MKFENVKKSKFTGNTFGLMGIYVLTVLLSGLTLGLGTPWASCMMIRWIAKNTVIDGKRFEFKGTGGRLWGAMLLWALVPVIVFIAGTVLVYFFPNETVGLLVYAAWCLFLLFYVFWVMLQEIKWYVKHTHFVEEKKMEMNEDDMDEFSNL